jgi:hypothetical protein
MRNTLHALLLVTLILTTACGGGGGGVNALPPLPAFLVTAPTTVTSGASATASVPVQAGVTYTWSISNGTITSPGGASGVDNGITNSITFIAGKPGTLVLGCGGLNPGVVNAAIVPITVVSGQTTISGTINGAPFNTAATTFFIGHPDAASTTVVYVFSKPVNCHDSGINFGTMGWDTRLPVDTQVLKLKTSGTTVATYPVVKPPATGTPSPGQALAAHELIKPIPVQTSSGSGTVTFTSVTPGTLVQGSFSVAFTGTDQLNGTLEAAFCDVGMEP